MGERTKSIRVLSATDGLPYVDCPNGNASFIVLMLLSNVAVVLVACCSIAAKDSSAVEVVAIARASVSLASRIEAAVKLRAMPVYGRSRSQYSRNSSTRT